MTRSFPFALRINRWIWNEIAMKFIQREFLMKINKKTYVPINSLVYHEKISGSEQEKQKIDWLIAISVEYSWLNSHFGENHFVPKQATQID